MIAHRLSTLEAARYLRFKTAAGVRAAVARGELRPSGRGAKGVYLFTLDELDRFAVARPRPANRTRTRAVAVASIRHRVAPCFVYFVESEVGLVKIGRANHPATRLTEMQTGSPVRLTLRATVRCRNRELAAICERTLHARFAGDRTSGEWFRATPRLDALVAQLRRRAAA